ncbi:undecaprenyl-phosphate glucose phosphotransferase [candidate division KSB1 bacterium]|nr:undecaprenyl-phosphate glucose phosphotransferase [candidate division KSB1 bacterium]
MPKVIERIMLLFSDFITVVASFFILITLRKSVGLTVFSDLTLNLALSLFTFGYWFVLFIFFGLYRSWYAQSRLDEIVAILKTVTIGSLLWFILTADIEQDIENPLRSGRLTVFSYWVILVIMLSAGRMALRTFQRKLLEAGIGVRNTLILGWNKIAQSLFDEIKKFPALGYRVIGFVSEGSAPCDGEYNATPVLGSIKQLSQLVKRHRVEEIIIALPGASRKKVVNAITRCDGLPVNLKIVPDLYDIVLGQARTNQLYGFPLIEIMPEMMPAWEKKVKRVIDLAFSIGIIFGLLPLWIIVALAIKLTSRGPVFFRQKRVGKDGKIFTIYKFRSMYRDAEKRTGPVWAEKKDPRITPVGKLIRKLRIDEFPQFINILNGDMSLVGPRPERPYFVKKLKHHIPLYARRFKIKPGITGWAQIKGEYDTTIENVNKKLEYDLFYQENMSLRMDLKIIFNTILTMIRGKGQ